MEEVSNLGRRASS